MNMWFFVAMIALAAVIVGVAGYVNHLRAQKILAYAQAHGLTYTKRDDRWVDIDLGWPAGIGRSHKAKNVLTGAYDGRPFVCFEHEWVTDHGENSSTHTARVVAVGIPRPLPKLEVRQEGLLGRAARRMGIKDIELESEQFNQQYRVKGQRRLAYDVLSPRLMEWMLAHGSDGFTINESWLAYACNGKINVEGIESSLRYVDAIADQLPAFVTNR